MPVVLDASLRRESFRFVALDGYSPNRMDGGTQEENDESRSRGGTPTTRNDEQLGEGVDQRNPCSDHAAHA